jgi:hypothetical protein
MLGIAALALLLAPLILSLRQEVRLRREHEAMLAALRMAEAQSAALDAQAKAQEAVLNRIQAENQALKARVKELEARPAGLAPDAERNGEPVRQP